MAHDDGTWPADYSLAHWLHDGDPALPTAAMHDVRRKRQRAVEPKHSTPSGYMPRT